MKGILFILATFIGCTTAYCPIIPVPGGLSGSANMSGYWDCCKPTCAWGGNVNSTVASSPVRSCAANGTTTEDINAMTGCIEDGSGTAYMCNDQQPIILNDYLSIGFAAASFKDSPNDNKCCSCMYLAFQDDLVGKQMIVQVTNTGGDLKQNTFDIAIPGAGVGLFNGCKSQWGAPEDGWGRRYGGVTTIEECDLLPKPLQSGCKWRFTWFQGANNPHIEFFEVKCPQELLDISNCQ